MTQLIWGAAGARRYEAGIDRGVLFVPGLSGVPWLGLTSVKEAPSGGEPKSYYLDGIKFQNVSSMEEFEATISAISAPTEFDICNGVAQIANGLFVTQQPRKPFGFSYRTLLGNDTDGLSYGYKIHLVYNALSSPSGQENNTLDDSPDPINFSWDISTIPAWPIGFRPTAHFVIDSTKTPIATLQQLEAILYGSTMTDSRLPTIQEIIDLFSSFVPIRITAIDQGAYKLENVSITEARAIMGSIEPSVAIGEDPMLWIDTSEGDYATLKLVTGV